MRLLGFSAAATIGLPLSVWLLIPSGCKCVDATETSHARRYGSPVETGRDEAVSKHELRIAKLIHDDQSGVPIRFRDSPPYHIGAVGHDLRAIEYDLLKETPFETSVVYTGLLSDVELDVELVQLSEAMRRYRADLTASDVAFGSVTCDVHPLIAPVRVIEDGAVRQQAYDTVYAVWYWFPTWLGATDPGTLSILHDQPVPLLSDSVLLADVQSFSLKILKPTTEAVAGLKKLLWWRCRLGLGVSAVSSPGKILLTCHGARLLAGGWVYSLLDVEPDEVVVKCAPVLDGVQTK